jgi:hypothetical protein
MSAVFIPDYGAVQDLGKHYNANIDYSAQHCVAGTPPPLGAPEAKGDGQVKPRPWWHLGLW